jgi:hypothetical protein
MDNGADAPGGATTSTVGFQLFDKFNQPLREEAILEMGVFDDADAVNLAANATLGSASVGTILGGVGTALIKVRTDNLGKFTCVLTNLFDETNWLTCAPSFGGHVIECYSIDSVQFSA